MLKAETPSGQPVVTGWKSRLSQVFERLSGHLIRLFPTPSLSAASERSSPPGQPHEDDYYAWQFLALLAMNLESGPCHEMIAELRAPILTNANSSNALPSTM